MTTHFIIQLSIVFCWIAHHINGNMV